MNRQFPTLLGLCVLMALLTVDLAWLGVSFDGVGRMLVMGALVVVGAFVVLRSPGFSQHLGRAEVALLLGSFAWVLLVSPLGWNASRGAIVAAALLATTVIGLEVGRTKGWIWFLNVLGPVLLIVLLVAVVIETVSSEPGRWIGWAEEPNSLGVIAAIGVVVAVSGRLEGRWWLAPLLPVGILVLVMTEARMPIVAAAAGSVLALRPRLGRGSTSAVIAVGFVAASALLVLALNGGTTSDSEQIDEIGSLNGRTTVWSLIVEEVEEAPFAGIGTEATQEFLEGNQDQVSWGPTHAHNAFFQMALHGGWPAAFIFVAAFVGYWRRARFAPVSSRDAVVLTLFLIGITEHLVREPALPLLVFAAAIGSLANPSTHQRDGARRVASTQQQPERHNLAGASQ